MKKRIAIPLLCLCVALLLAGGLALLIHSGLSFADALGVLLEVGLHHPGRVLPVGHDAAGGEEGGVRALAQLWRP